MIIREARQRPLSWPERKKTVPSWSIPFFALEWIWEWLAFLLSRWSFVEVLEYMGSLSILVAVFFYFHDADNRVKQRHYQAWQVVNTAQGKGGSGGRIEALEELNYDRVSLIGVDVSGAFLQGVNLSAARLLRSDFSGVDARNSDLHAADLQDANLHSANFRQSNFQRASLLRAQIDDADFHGADLTEADLSGAILDRADLSSATLKAIKWKGIRSIKGANLHDVREAPDGFLAWALKRGATQAEGGEQ